MFGFYKIMLNPISFTGTFCIQQTPAFAKNREKIAQKRFRCEMLIEDVKYRDKIDETHITVPDYYDDKTRKLLDKYNIDYYYFNILQHVNKDEIIERMKLDPIDKMFGMTTVNIDVEQLDKILEIQSPCHVGYKGQNGDIQKYNRFKRFLYTKNEIKPPTLSVIKDTDNNIKLEITDGRHRFAVLKDIGMKKIPVIISEESRNIATGAGLIKSKTESDF